MFCLLIWALIFVNIFCTVGSRDYSNRTFPKYFKFGVATSAYQYEGAWNADGKGVSIIDHFIHTNPNYSIDGKNGDVALDFYHKYRDDIGILRELGIDFLRLSISWPRILPYGTKQYINWKGIQFYRSLFTELLRNGIEPMVTIYHWDIPQDLQYEGGLLNDCFVGWFEDYATILFLSFGDLVKTWTTFNEPNGVCSNGYGKGDIPPGLKGDGVLDYQCGHNLLKAHARVYHVYDERFRATQKGEVGIVLMSDWFVPGSSNFEDIQAAETAVQFMLGWFANPIAIGDYPEVMKSRIRQRSLLEGRSESRLPKFTPEEIDYIRGTYDYLGLNYYNSYLAFAMAETPLERGTSYDFDMGARLGVSPHWKPTCIERFHVAPSGMRSFLVFIKKRYGDVPIYITENGVCDFGGLNDTHRVDFLKSHLSELLVAMVKDKVDVRKYTHWSAFDDFEWGSGYETKFGLYHVDFENQDLPRTAKESAKAYKEIIKKRCLVETCHN